MHDHYKTLGVNSSATLDEIRRAYRILARRYHPDLNPGAETEDKFKAIAAAYDVLGDSAKRNTYDMEYERLQFDSLFNKFKKNQNYESAARRGTHKFGQVHPEGSDLGSNLSGTASQGIFAPIANLIDRYKKKLRTLTRANDASARSAAKAVPSHQNVGKKISIIEVSVSTKDSIFGVKKTVEIPEPEGKRKVSVVIPPGVRTGSVVRMVQESSNRRQPEELVIIVRAAAHPLISVQNKGLVVEVPVTISEALFGASISLPTLDEPAVVKIPPGSQSGTEIRLKGKGIKFKDGSHGDIIYKINIRIPDSVNAVGIKEKLGEFEQYYESAPRKGLPNTLLDFE